MQKPVPDNNITRISREDIVSLKNGSEEAFLRIYYAYLTPLKRCMEILMGSEDNADEVVQEVFVWFWEKRAMLDPNMNLRNYLFVSSRNAAFKIIQKQKKYEDLSGLNNMLADDYLVADEQIIAKDTELLLEIAIANMPENRRNVMTLFREGLSYSEIADRLDMKPDNVRQHIKAGRDALRELTLIILFFLTNQ